ncbi:type II secretion system F family protein [Nocardioides sp. Y6]|uniref:Type II secretion system F family protein n=1 Tax=Nocardioides malaquae TaxID=2773426 RepID=A0ABR9RUZ7_9ACTN|nr:type II secretion system F family protein [Nocardioides malaquae]MBE7325432.1 type II secretion system F family protein [Nocardioides malaquae]
MSGEWWVAAALFAAVLVAGAGHEDRLRLLGRRTMAGRGAWSAPVLGGSVLNERVPGGPVRGGQSAPLPRWHPRGRRRARIAAAERALEACGVMAEELRAGRDAGSALACAAEVCPELGPAVQAHELGADVPAALRATGVPALGRVAGAWQVSARSGLGLAETVRAVADDLRADSATRRVVVAELASARATARLLVALPAVALLVGSGSGGAPWRFFASGVPGALCGLVGTGLLLTGLWWIERIADAVEVRA